MSTEEIIRPILQQTYGESTMTEALVVELAVKIDAFHGGDRERMVCMTCWNWMPGGSTANSVAKKIEEALATCWNWMPGGSTANSVAKKIEEALA